MGLIWNESVNDLNTWIEKNFYKLACELVLNDDHLHQKWKSVCNTMRIYVLYE